MHFLPTISGPHARTWLRGSACPRRFLAILPTTQRAGLFGGD